MFSKMSYRLYPLILVMILAVNCYSVNLATNVQNIFTAAKLVAIAIIVCGGAYKLILGNISCTKELPHCQSNI